MTFTIEPMLTLGTHDWDMWDDGWTVVTKDRRRSAQFEHTLLVTERRRRDPDAALARPHPAHTSTRHERAAMDHEIGLGIDIGGSGIKGAPVNLQTGGAGRRPAGRS